MSVKPYSVYSEKAINPSKKFKHVMALSLHPSYDYKKGVLRCIISREGSLKTGSVDRSLLYKVEGNSLRKFMIKKPIEIQKQDKIIKKIEKNGWDFLGFEDPDLWVDSETGLTHLYFTMPFIPRKGKKTVIYMGHAVGKDLDSLEMRIPVVRKSDSNLYPKAKELSIAPPNKKGVRYNLIESNDFQSGVYYSVVRTVLAKTMDGPWIPGKIVFHPKKENIPWIGGHASPGPLFPKTFVDIGESKMLGIMNGCEENKVIDGETRYGTFAVGLFVYDYEKGRVDWVSKKPLIDDSKNKSRKITFASQFVQTASKKGVLYAHIDDSFVRAYLLNADAIVKLVPKEFRK